MVGTFLREFHHCFSPPTLANIDSEMVGNPPLTFSCAQKSPSLWHTLGPDTCSHLGTPWCPDWLIVMPPRTDDVNRHLDDVCGRKLHMAWMARNLVDTRTMQLWPESTLPDPPETARDLERKNTPTERMLVTRHERGVRGAAD